MQFQITKLFFKDLMTEDDGESFCLAKVMAVIAFFSFIGYAGYGLYTAKTYNLNDFANGSMMVLTGCGAIIGAKQITQKDKSKSD